jgi:hypothetical protein
MSSENDIGSKLQSLKNPLRLFGYIEAALGLCLICIALYMLFKVPNLVKADMLSGWITAIVGIFLLLKAVHICWKGTYKSFSIVVGRNDPKSLSQNFANDNEASNKCFYDANQLAKMLKGRLNSSFIEPRGWLESLLFSVARKLLFLPIPYRNMLQNYAVAIIKSLVDLTCYVILFFLYFCGLLQGNIELALSVYTIYLSIRVCLIWKNAFVVQRNYVNSAENITKKKLVGSIVSAILIPTILVFIFNYIDPISKANSNEIVGFIVNYHWSMFFLCAVLFPLVLSFVAIFMLRYKSKEYNITTEVSEKIANWQESVHPQDLFIAVENKVMATRRYMEVPNRIYVKFNPNLVQETSDKGSFSGFTLQETQPVRQNIEESKFLVKAKLVASFIGNLLIFLSYVIFANTALNIGSILVLGDGSLTADYLVTRFLVMVLCYECGLLIYNTTLLFLSELRFKSMLMYFKLDGTFTESKISTGMSVYDSTRSENSLVRSSLSPWIIVSNVVSSTFLGDNLNKFENTRYVMEMHKNDLELEAIIRDLREFFASRQVIADISSKENLISASNILAINKKSRDVGNIDEEVQRISDNNE